MTRYKVAIVLMGMAMFVLSPTSASAWRVYQGSDYTVTVNSEYGFKVCDEESDGRAVRGHAKDDRGHEETESDGGDAGCDTRWNPPDMGKVYEMKTCEIIDFWPDACSDWKTKP